MQHTLLIVLGGVGIGTALSVPTLWPLVFISLLPMIRAVCHVSSRKELFMHGWLFGTVAMGSTLYWFFNTLPLTWLGITDPFISIVIVCLFWGVLSALLGSTIGAWALTARAIRTRPVIDMFTLSLLWVVFEYARMWLYTVVTYGSATTMEPFFSFGFIGYALAHNYYTLQLASVAGVFGLSFIVCVTAWALWLLLQRSRTSFFIVCAVIVGVSIIPAPSLVGERETLPVYPVQTNIPPGLQETRAVRVYKQEYITTQLRTIAATKPHVSVIVLPEFSNYTQQINSDTFKAFFADIFGDREVLLIDSERVDSASDAAQSAIVFFSTTQGEQARSYKRFMLPAGEYMPHLGTLALSVLGLRDELERLEQYRSYTPENRPHTYTHDGVTYTALTCSDAVSPLLYKQLSTSKPHILINASSLAWFHHGYNPRTQFLAMAKVHAVWNNAWYVQATNAGDSLLIHPTGQVF